MIGILYFGVSVLYIPIYSIPPLTVILIEDLGMTHFQVGLLSTSFMATFSVSNIGIGILSTRINQKTLMVWGLILGFLCSLLFAFSSHFVILMILRGGLGVSTACMISPCLIYLLSVLPGKRSLIISGHLASITLGIGLAFLFTPPLAEIVYWRTIVIFYSCLIGVAIIWFMAWVENIPLQRNEDIEIQDSIPSRSGLVMLLSMVFLIYIQIGANTIWLTPWLEEKFSFSPAHIGFHSMLFQMMGIPSSLLGGYLYEKTRNLLYLGSMGMLLSTINVGYIFCEGNNSFILIVLVLMLSRTGSFLCMGPLISLVPKFVHADSRGLTLGLAHSICAVGITTTSFLGGFIIDHTGEYHLLWIMAGISLLCTACILNPLFHKKWG
jgi:predicted MFS family arabinose efflux permease